MLEIFVLSDWRIGSVWFIVRSTALNKSLTNSANRIVSKMHEYVRCRKKIAHPFLVRDFFSVLGCKSMIYSVLK